MEEFEISTPETPPSRHRARKIVGTVVFVVFILGMLGFGFRVFSYYRKIQVGGLDTESLSFQRTTSTRTSLAAVAKAAPGSGELATNDDPSLGNPDARLTIVEFADFGCPFSQQESYVVRAIAKKFPNDIRLIYRDFPLVDLHPGADLAAEAGECAQEQGRFWEYHDVLYRGTADFSEDKLIDYAGQAGLNVNSFTTCLQSGFYTEEVKADMASGVAAGVTGTPTFFLNGQKVEGAIPFGIFTQLVEAFLLK